MIKPPAQLLSAFRTYLNSIEDEIAKDFIAGIDWEMPERWLEPNSLGCLRHLDRAVEITRPEERAPLALLADHRHAFHWGQTYTAADFGDRFIENYGWVELIGTRGHFANDRIAAGVLVLGPEIVYPDHHHIAEELYVPFTGGTEWRKGEGPFVLRSAGEVIHHPSNISHAMRTGVEPMVAFYLWRGGPLAQKSTITGSVT